MATDSNPTTGTESNRPLNEITKSHRVRRAFIGNLYKKVKDLNLVGPLSGHKEGSKAISRCRIFHFKSMRVHVTINQIKSITFVTWM